MSPPPTWLAELANRVATEMYPIDVMSPIGCHYFYSDESSQWDLTLFAADTEVVGGARDGSRSPSKFNLDLSHLNTMFSKITNFHWQALPMGPNDDLGPHVSVEGIFRGQRVWLRILSQSPECFETGRKAKPYELSMEDVW